MSLSLQSSISNRIPQFFDGSYAPADANRIINADLDNSLARSSNAYDLFICPSSGPNPMFASTFKSRYASICTWTMLSMRSALSQFIEAQRHRNMKNERM